MDIVLLSSLIFKKIYETDHVSLRQAARQIGTSPTTLSRAMNGENIDVETLVKICQWLNVRPGMILDTFSTGDLVLTQKIEALFSLEPKIKSLFIDLLIHFENQKIDTPIIEDILSYAVFRVKKSTSPDSKIP